MGLVTWILVGLVAGIIAKWLMPGGDVNSLLMTIVLGMVGSVVGGFLASLASIGTVSGFDLKSLVIAVGGSCLALFLFRKFGK